MKHKRYQHRGGISKCARRGCWVCDRRLEEAQPTFCCRSSTVPALLWRQEEHRALIVLDFDNRKMKQCALCLWGEFTENPGRPVSCNLPGEAFPGVPTPSAKRLGNLAVSEFFLYFPSPPSLPPLPPSLSIK